MVGNLFHDLPGLFPARIPDNAPVNDPMSKDGNGQSLNVTGNDKVPSLSQGQTLRRSVQRNTTSRTHSKSQIGMLTRCFDDIEDVIGNGFLHLD